MSFFNKTRNNGVSQKQGYNEKKASMIFIDDILWEQIKTDNGDYGYLGWNTKKMQVIPFEKFISDKNRRLKYVPIIDDSVGAGAVLIPTDAVDYKDEVTLETEINNFIEKWLDVSDEYREKSTWYVMLTWVTDNLNTIPYLRPLGDYGTGKTRFEDAVGGLCYKPMFFGGAANIAPMYRMMNLWKGTLILDEFNIDRSDDKSDIIQILNNGYQRGKPVLRCNPNDVSKVDAFDPFGPKIMVTRSRFRDKALESRCLTEIMKETTRKDIPIDLTKEFFEDRDLLRNKLLMYRFKNWNVISVENAANVDFGDVMPRIKQTFLPFTALFYKDKNRLMEFVKYVKECNQRIVEENASTFDGQVINAYVELLNEGIFKGITAQNILERTIQNNGCRKETNVRTIGRHLSSLGFDKTVPKKVNGKTVRVVSVSDENLERLKKRYVVS